MMGGSSINGLSAAQLAIYTPLALLTIYILLWHGRRGRLGWLYLLAFEVLRLTGSGLTVKNQSSPGSSALTISAIGLSPLLLANLGILHEARTYSIPNLRQKLELILVLVLHIIVATGLGIMATGASALGNPTTATASNQNLVKIGSLILIMIWVVLVVITCLSLRAAGHDEKAEATEESWRAERDVREGKMLLKGVLFSLLFVGIRAAFSVASSFAHSAKINPVTGTLAIRVCLAVLPEMIVTIILIAVGLMTRNIGR